jgi:AcrR family transcriptional regulator
MTDSDLDEPSVPPRRRDAAATREAILRSALVAFTRSGYDGVGVREIAQAAGVTAMLVNRYFGSKEQLFAEVVDVAFAEPVLLGEDVTTLARDVATGLMSRTVPGRVDGFLLMLRSAANPRSARILRDGVERHYGRRLAALLPGTRTDERAALFLALIAGVQLMRDVLDLPALADADPAGIEALFRLLIEPPPAKRA